MGVYPKGKKWRVVVWHQGQRHDWIQEGTKAEAKQFEAAKRVELRGRDPSTAGRAAPTFSDFSTGAYQAHAKDHLKARTWSNRVYTLATLCETFGEMKLTDIHTATVEQYKHDRLESKIKASTLNDELKVLRSVLSYARELGFPVALPSIKNVSTHGVRRKVQFWTDAEVDKLIKAVRRLEPQIEPLVMFLLNTGCRKGEALALEWTHVDLERRLIRIEPGEEWQPKNGEAREIPISDGLLPYLKAPRKHARWVFPSSDGERFAYWPQRYFDRARKAAGLTGGPHTTRHTFATHFLRGKPDLFLLGRILGHGNAYVTELYAHLLPDHLAAARNVVSFGKRQAKKKRA